MKLKRHLFILGLFAGTLSALAQGDTPAPKPAALPAAEMQETVSITTNDAALSPLDAALPSAEAETAQPIPTVMTDIPATPAPSREDAATNDSESSIEASANEAVEGETIVVDEIVPLIVIDDVPLTDAVRNLARQSAINFMFDPQITSTNQPNISLRFENVTAEEALLAVLENHNMMLNKRAKSKIARISIKDPQAEEPLVVEIVQLKYSDPTNLVAVLEPSLSARSRILADGRTRQLIVTTTEKEMEKLVPLIDQLDTRTKQVLIEARILETSKNPSTIKGINWAPTLEAQSMTFGNNVRVPTSTESINSINHDLSGGIPGAIAGTTRGSTPATAFLNADGVKAVLSFFNKDSDTEVLATPRAVTLDNQPAQLAVTRAFPIFQITPGSANSPAGASIQYTNLGTILTVTPRIAADNNISMKVVPEVSNIDGKDEQILNGDQQVANIYAVRRIETTVLIPSAHTLVMGGLINDASTKAYSKVPILGDIPILGFAFRHSSKERKKQNLVIFVTPTIVAEEDFQVAANSNKFLQTQYADKPEVEPTAWDSAKPKDWTQPKN